MSVLFVCCAAGALAITEVLSAALSSIDPHYTKTTLEHIERELCRHVSRLVAQQTPVWAPPQPVPVETEPVAGPSGLAVVGVDEESSSPSGQYATAVSLSSVEAEDQPSSGLFLQPANGDDDRQVMETAI